MVAIPIGYDQPGVAARIAHHGVGEFLEIEDLTVERLRHLIERVLDNPRYRDKARWFQKVITQKRGLDVAAKVIERGFKRYYKVGVNSSLRSTGRGQNIAAQTD
jgi:UDP:flavonoid glycosyltransferase YjiC (YdhE family)